MRVATGRRRLTSGAVLLLSVFAWTTPTGGQAPADIGIATYRAGNVEAALRVFASHPRAVRDGAVRRLRESRPEPRQLLAAAMLHTELAARDVSSPQDAMSLLERAEDIVTVARDLRGDVDIPGFQRAWYPFAASIFLSRTEPTLAREWVDRGAKQHATSGRSHLALGTAFEMFVFLSEPECGRPKCPGRTSRSPIPGLLGGAVDAYRDGLREEPTLAELRLRLGRVQFLGGQFAESERTLRGLEAEALLPDQAYLTHLFLADLRGSQRDLAGARREYEAAVRAVPAPSALLGLANVLARLGLADDARSAAERALAAGENGEDPWLPYRFGAVNVELLQHLRERVR